MVTMIAVADERSKLREFLLGLASLRAAAPMKIREGAEVAMHLVHDWQGNPLVLQPDTFWHLTTANGFFQNNARVNKGIVLSISAAAQIPGLENAVSPYSLARANDPKEILWETIRAQNRPVLPSRLKSFYCFDNKELAERAKREWFQGDPNRLLLRVRLAHTSIVHRCDAELLNAVQNKWRENAIRYWEGEMTATPFPETLVHGAVYAIDWESFPIGLSP